uniref:Uncharacterized protein n=1 Tax=Picea glauca TaxID=3330 RepID=A0A101M5Q5_PICGL|nr:hypothetical protein ABT39_MTgene1189 [Picea glauca]
MMLGIDEQTLKRIHLNTLPFFFRLPSQMDSELLHISCFDRPNQHICMVQGC